MYALLIWHIVDWLDRRAYLTRILISFKILLVLVSSTMVLSLYTFAMMAKLSLRYKLVGQASITIDILQDTFGPITSTVVLSLCIFTMVAKLSLRCKLVGQASIPN